MNLETTLSMYFGGFGSGCQGPNCGRKPSVVYHGTSAARANGIFRDGLKVKSSRNLSDTWTGTFATSDKDIALSYARDKAKQSGGNHALVVFKDAEKAGFKNKDPERGLSKTHTWFSKKDIPARHVARVELYRTVGNKSIRI